jgi:hypothetical protein
VNHISEIATVAFACFLVHIFFNGWFGVRGNKRLRNMLFMTLYFLFHSIVSLLTLNPIHQATLSLILVFGIASTMYETTLLSALYSSLLFLALAILSEYSSLVLLNILGFETSTLMVGGYTRIVLLVLAKTVHFMVVLIATSILQKNRIALTPKQVAPLLPCFIVSIYICIVFFIVFPDVGENLSIILVVALIGLLYINGIVVFNIQLIKNNAFENEEQRLVRQQYEMQERYYHNVLKDQEETRALWHDIKKHIKVIEAVVELSDSQLAKNEYDQIYQSFDELGNVVDIENAILNVILFHNIDRAKSHNISVSLDVRVSPVLPFSATDLSVIIGNTFDNAIEECIILAGANPQINVTLIQQNQMLFYEITNPYLQISHKKVGNIRGYGLKNVKRCVDKYHGSMEYGTKNEQYIVSIRLNCSSSMIIEQLKDLRNTPI